MHFNHCGQVSRAHTTQRRESKQVALRLPYYTTVNSVDQVPHWKAVGLHLCELLM